jgi:hypothetical protein
MNEGDVIFLSASVPVREGWCDGARPAEVEEAIVSVARAVFARKGRLLFGGHPSVSPLVAAVAGEYFAPDPERRVRPIVTFQSRLFQNELPDETTEMVKMGWSTIEWTPRSPGDDKDEVRRHSLNSMRARMLPGPGMHEEIFKPFHLRPPAAMVAIGGMGGVCDEAFVFLTNRHYWKLPTLPPIFSFKSGGGAAARLINRELASSRLWPEGFPDPGHLETLSKASRNGDILDVEGAWRAKFGSKLPSEIPFEPYAAMAQWLLDTLPPSSH